MDREATRKAVPHVGPSSAAPRFSHAHGVLQTAEISADLAERVRCHSSLELGETNEEMIAADRRRAQPPAQPFAIAVAFRA